MTLPIIKHSIKSEIKDTLSIGLPLIASQLVYSCSGFIGTAFVAKLGEDALAASVLVTSIWITLSILFFGLLNSISVLVSHQYGAGNHQAISKIMGQAFLLGLIIAAIMILLLLNMPFFLGFANQPKAVTILAIDYMHALILTVPGLLLLIIYEQFLAGINRTKTVLRISLLVVPIEIPIIYILIFGKFGLPKCGIAGIGLGFSMTYTMTALLMTAYFIKTKHYQPFGIFKNLKAFDAKWFKELIRVGLPMGLMHTIEIGAFMVLTFWIANFGTTLLAAHQIVIQYLNFVITIVFAMAQAVTIRVGYAVGKLDSSGISFAIYIGMLLSFACMLVLALLFNFVPHFFLALDISVHAAKNQQLVSDGSMLLGICGILLLFDNFRIIGFGALRGLKDTKFPMYLSIVAFGLVGLSLSYYFGFTLKLGGAGIWWGLVAGVLFGAVVIFIRIQWLISKLDSKQLELVRMAN